MRLIVCLDDRGGMMFGGRRQSQDRVLRARVMELTRGHKLWMSAYSAKQFADFEEILVDDRYAQMAGEEDYCFAEDGAVPLDGVTELIVYRWNRLYPADLYFDVDLQKNGFSLCSSCEFTGSSHDKITKEIYRR